MDLTEFAEKEARDKEKRVESLVDLLVRTLLDSTAPEINTLVGHRFPDDDAWLSLWMAKKFIPKAKDAQIVFVNAGEILPGSEGNPSVLHFDTGKGSFDQHGKGLKKSCSAVLLAEHLGITDDPGLKPLLELATAVDNINPLPATSIHYAIEGYPRHFLDGNRHPDWKKTQERVFELFDIVYNQETCRAESRKTLKEYCEWTSLPNGLKVASILWHPECREAAFEQGAAVVIWTEPRGKKHFYTGMQVNRKYPHLMLDNAAALLRAQEAQARHIILNHEDLHYVGREGLITVWYLHDSKRLVINGSRTWRPDEDDYTKLVPRQITGLVNRSLSAIPREIVSRWNR